MGSAVGLLLDNPFEDVVIESLEADLHIGPEDRLSSVWAADVSQVTAKPGQTVSVSVTLRSRRSEETTVKIPLTIPRNLAKGKYALLLLPVALPSPLITHFELSVWLDLFHPLKPFD